MNEARLGEVTTITARLGLMDIEDGAVVVTHVRGSDALSGVAGYRVTVVSDAATAEQLDATLGKDAKLTLTRLEPAEVTHVFHGLVEEVVPEGQTVGNAQRRTEVLLVPKLGELAHRSNHAIFQDKDVVEIAKALLEPWGIALEARLDPAPKKREFCCQVGETDLGFLARILAEDGVHYHLEHGDAAAKVVLVNDPIGYHPIPGNETLPFRAVSGSVTTEHVRTIARARRLRTGAVVYRDHNFLVPEADMTARGEHPEPGAPGTLARRELYDYPGHYDHPDAEDVGHAPDVQWPTAAGRARAKLRLEEQRADALTFTGTSTCLRLRVGHTFTIADHPDRPFDQTYLVTELRVEHVTEEASRVGPLAHALGAPRVEPEALVRFTAVLASTPVRPRRRPKPPAHVRIARVVGPKADEPYVDAYGRIKIQLAWDRDGRTDEKSSCWVRTMTPTAHHGQGTYVAHRVGAEVVVDFLDGDVDRPIVLGALFHGENKQPQALPGDATRAVLYKGLSVPGNAGNNELSIEDKQGHEEIKVHAQRDLNATIERNHSEAIGANQSTAVGANQSVSVGANQSVAVGKDRNLTVSGKETTKITKHREETVDDGETVTVKNGRGHTVATGNDTLAVSAGDRMIEVSGLHKTQAKNRTDVITETVDIAGGQKVVLHHGADAGLELIAGEAKLTTTKKITISNPSGSITLADGKVTIAAASELALTCGSAAFSLKSDGTVTGSGSKEVSLACSNSSLKLEPPKATIAGAGVDVNAVGQCMIGGAIIKIG